MADFVTRDGKKISCGNKAVASGASGEIWKSLDQKQIVKIYRDPTKYTVDQLEMIVSENNPLASMESAERSFWEDHVCWPTAIVVKPSLGVVMPCVDLTQQLKHLLLPKWREENIDPHQQGWWKGRLELGLRLARAVRLCHQSGLCHSDLSDNNALIDLSSGKLTMIDLDGLVINGKINATVVGTRLFMAPELVTGKTKPNLSTDRHALAVIIYKLLMDRHPLYGRRKFLKAASSEEADRLMFGEEPLYNEHPTDTRNRTASNSSSASVMGPYLEALFKQAFIDGLTSPEKRPLAADWEEAIARTLDRLVPCNNQKCRINWFVLNREYSLNCPSCGQLSRKAMSMPILIPYRDTYAKGVFRMVEAADVPAIIVGHPRKTLFLWHLYLTLREDGRTSNAPQITIDYTERRWLLSNHMTTSIECCGLKTDKAIRPGETVVLQDQMLLHVGEEKDSYLFEVRLPFNDFYGKDNKRGSN